MSVQEVNKSSIHYSTSKKKSTHNHLEATTEHPEPPPKNETAKMARYIVHYSDWCILAHISHHDDTSGFPAALIYSTADGPTEGSTGTPYFYVTKRDAHINDLSLVPESSEAQKAKRFLFKRHPVMESWPKGHNWQLGKVKISHIQVVDNFGGSAYPSIQEYFGANP